MAQHHRNRALRLPAGLSVVGGLLTSTLETRIVTARTAAAGPRYGGTIEVAFTSDVTSFDPAQAYAIDWSIMNGTLFNGLCQYDRRSVPQFDLAAAPPAVSPDRSHDVPNYRGTQRRAAPVLPDISPSPPSLAPGDATLSNLAKYTLSR